MIGAPIERPDSDATICSGYRSKVGTQGSQDRDTDMDALTIGTLAAETGVNIETIRYYERIGLVPKPPRSAGGRRSYGPRDFERLRFVRRCRELGFSRWTTSARC